LILAFGILATDANSIVIRHDVPDSAYLRNAAELPAVFAMSRHPKSGTSNGIATLIAAEWAVTAAHCARQQW
jgi:hypothetical protein